MILFEEKLPRGEGQIRIIHAIPNGPAVDVYADGKLIYKNLIFANVTKYIDVPAGTYKIQLYKAGSKNNLLITENYQVILGSVSTIAVTYANNEISFFALDDTHNTFRPKFASVRFINLSPDSQLLSLRLPENIVLFNEAAYLETNEGYPLAEGIYNFVVVNADDSFEKYISNIDLKKDDNITIYVVGLFKGRPKAGYILLKDAKRE